MRWGHPGHIGRQTETYSGQGGERTDRETWIQSVCSCGYVAGDTNRRSEVLLSVT